MGLWDKIEDALEKAEETATGAAGGAIGALLSLPHASLVGLTATVQGQNPIDAVGTIMATYESRGEDIGREFGGMILHVLLDASKEAAKIAIEAERLP
jgi:hypothetical protein